jgi:hypothetical protein
VNASSVVLRGDVQAPWGEGGYDGGHGQQHAADKADLGEGVGERLLRLRGEFGEADLVCRLQRSGE